jgi:hypothetical protein
MQIPIVTLDQLRQLTRHYEWDVCAECAARYVPCAALLLQYDEDCVTHIIPVFYNLKAGEEKDKIAKLSFQGRLCDGLKPPLWQVGFVAIHPALNYGNFVEAVLKRYPELEGKPLTAELLQQAQCDLIAEIAMWQFAGG